MPGPAPRSALVNRLDPLPQVVTVPEPLPRPSRLLPAAMIALVLVGCGLRVAAWMGSRNLWIDESMLALNLVERSPAGLLEPLDWNQGAPVGFLLAVKAVITELGTSERTLRLVPLVGSCLGVFGFAWLAWRMMPRPAALMAAGLYCVSPVLLSYSAECKQYATDAAIAIGLFAASIGLLQGEGGVRRWIVLALAGAAAVWFSHPAVFVLGGIGTALFLAAAIRKDRTRIAAASLTITTWLISFGTCYVLFLKNLGSNQYLLDYWTGHFLTLPPKELGDVVWLADHFFALFSYPGGMGGSEIRAGGIAAGLFVLGVWGFWKERWTVAAALVLPAVFALAASALHKYPFAGRLMLFLVPLLVFGVARGAWMLTSAVWSVQPAAAVTLLGILFSAPALEGFQELRRPARSEQLAPVLAELRTQVRPTDRVYIYYGALPAFEFYSREAPLPMQRLDRGEEARADATEYRRQLANLAGEPRVWLVFSHRHKHEESIIVAYAEGLGRCEQTIVGTGAAAFLYDFSKPPR